MAYPPVSYDGRSSAIGDPRRSQQINELVSAFPSVKPLDPTRSIMECPLQMRDGRTIQLRLHIPTYYPNEPPQFVLSELINHPWVDQNAKVNLPMCQNWKVHYTLVEALQTAQSAILGGGPPNPGRTSIPQQTIHRPSMSGPLAVSSEQQSTPYRTQKIGPHAVDIEQHLQQYTNEELYGFLTKTEDYESLVQALRAETPVLKSMEELRRGIVQIAQENLDRESEITELQNQINIIQSTEYASTCQVYEAKVEAQQRVQNLISIPELVKELEIKASALNTKSEALHESALNGENDLGNLLEEYCNLRQEFHKADTLAKASAKLC